MKVQGIYLPALWPDNAQERCTYRCGHGFRARGKRRGGCRGGRRFLAEDIGVLERGGVGSLAPFLTNNFTLPALTIARLYKCRWQVELFFKWIKQHLRIKGFFGTSENAVKT